MGRTTVCITECTCVHFLLLCLTFNCRGTTVTTYRPTTTPPTTIPPLGPLGWCNYEGVWYEDGENIRTDGCSGIMCVGGALVVWDKWCAFYASTQTTIPTTPPGSCLGSDGVWYPDGATMGSSCENPHCCGTICRGGGLMVWDHECSPTLRSPPPCNGWNEYVDYQCCPICHGVNTTTSPTTVPETTTSTTTPPLPFCFHNGQLYNNYDIFDLNPNGCYGKECHYGVVRPWRKHCSVSEENCDGTLVNVTGQCCLICEDIVKTTLPSSEPHSTSTPTSTSTTNKVCVIRGVMYALNMRTNNDECYKCYCTLRGEECHMTMCDDVTDCVNTIRPKGECCFICSDSNSISTISLLLLPVLLIDVLIS